MVRVAVCICTCDRAALLARVLAVLARVELDDLPPENVLLLVVDNRPDGQARAVCERQRPRLPMPLRFVEEPRPGISFARNRAVAAARAWGADLVAFLDDDDVPATDWLWQLVQRQRETEADLVFGFWPAAAGPAAARLAAQHPLLPPAATGGPQPVRPAGLGRHLQCADLPPGAGAAHDRRWTVPGRVRHAAAARTWTCSSEPRLRASPTPWPPHSIVDRAWEPDRMTIGGIATARLPARQARA